MAEKQGTAPKEMSTAEAIQKLAEAILENGPKGPLELAGLTPERQKEITTPPPPQKWRIIPGLSHDTKSTFDMVVVESRRFKNGRIVRLENYSLGKGKYLHESEGGIVPDGLSIFNNNGVYETSDDKMVPKDHLTKQYLEWRWGIWKQDLQRVVGELRSHYCVDPGGMQTPWKMSDVGLKPPTEVD